jgi:predicted MFS family arabinose efflux permease
MIQPPMPAPAAPDRHARPRPAHLIAAGVLTLGLVGDAMLYAVLPAAADTYAIGAVGVAAALSLNRFVRLALNPLAARWLGRVGLRAGTVTGAALAAASTAAYALAPGLAWLLAARVAWGAAFATLRLSVLAYATREPRGAARRLGSASALQEIAPAALLLMGTAALAWLGVRGLFAALAALTLLAVPLALLLPRAQAPAPREASPPERAPRPRRQPTPWRAAAVSTSVALGVDGALMAGVVLALIAIGWAPLAAAQAGGVLLAARKLAQVAVAAVAGRVGERIGVVRSVRLGALATALGLAAMALGPWSTAALLGGAVVAMLSSPLVSTLVPAVVAGGDTAARLRQLGTLATARDLGAALGAAGAPLLLAGAAGPAAVVWTFATAAALVVLTTLGWRASPAAT